MPAKASRYRRKHRLSSRRTAASVRSSISGGWRTCQCRVQLPCISPPQLRSARKRRNTLYELLHTKHGLRPSRCSLMTGWPVHVRGHRSLYYLLHPDEPNLLRYLKDDGYDVYFFGKNDVFSVETFPLSVTKWGTARRTAGDTSRNPYSVRRHQCISLSSSTCWCPAIATTTPTTSTCNRP